MSDDDDDDDDQSQRTGTLNANHQVLGFMRGSIAGDDSTGESSGRSLVGGGWVWVWVL